jgi:glycosyltransferase involved in cell wall biosynthesis
MFLFASLTCRSFHEALALVQISVVIPVHSGGERTIGDCLRALEGQTLPRGDYEVIVVADGGAKEINASLREGFDVRLLSQEHKGAPSARNTGWRAAEGEWVAFTDHDCIPSRTWLSSLLNVVSNGKESAFGAAGPIFGFESYSPPARFVDLTHGLDSERLLSHPTFPFAPSGNLMYRRDAVAKVGGFDERYCSYDACDLHTRLRQVCEGGFYFEPRAVVLHRHRASWRAYWHQQLNYGRGLGQFFLHHQEVVEWSLWREMCAWSTVVSFAVRASLPGRDDASLIRRGNFVKHLAQRVGFVNAYWNWDERKRW